MVRDLLFKGAHTYKALQNAGEGIATNILSDRLHTLVATGLVEKWPNPNDARQHDYHLTEAGFALAPTLVEMVLWSAAHFETDAPPETLALMRSNRAEFLTLLHKQWQAGRNAVAMVSGGAIVPTPRRRKT
ncbi:winged helix-turn-helix transcriptional regulator [Ahniella affigens]|uniref:winged helix-turn-helix transcriptional regulator n=1 Tax=Ahniella affigens TaxID=2021234 RepID=UPI00197E7D72|nr:winged helix-turn-helix transcriptional regulator [Ahniella affigens]